MDVNLILNIIQQDKGKDTLRLFLEKQTNFIRVIAIEYKYE